MNARRNDTFMDLDRARRMTECRCQVEDARAPTEFGDYELLELRGWRGLSAKQRRRADELAKKRRHDVGS
jgi:hypothetical protein